MSKYRSILTKYWGFDKFRGIQEEIIESIGEGKDTLGLMPTGGGKSITFQVYSLSSEGVCLVVTPLIALMKDQVENLKKNNIKAAAIYSGMTKREIEIALNNVINGGYKFLYLSPERLKNYYFQQRLRDFNVNLITVDEAHCISQWGYDFRPSYLEIAKIRETVPDTPVLALTATATPEVVDDIQERLNFKEKNVFQQSFERKNLVYYIYHTENKMKKLFKVVNQINGSGVIYVRNRKKTKEYALLLKKYNVSADYYHAGLSTEERSFKQQNWQKDKIRIMVCTNAFGMGIDKPDVRFVVHLDLPDSPEAYFQEAGRGGRDGNKAYAFLIFNNSDLAQLKKSITLSFPKISKVLEVYSAICNFLQIPVGAGKDIEYPFDIFSFAKNFGIDVITSYNCIKILESTGILSYTEDANSLSRVMFTINRDDLYRFQISNPDYDGFIKLLLRTYTGIFTDFINISESYLSKKATISAETVINYLKLLQKQNIVRYIPRINKPLLHFHEERLENKAIPFNKKQLKEQKERVVKRMESMLVYATSTNKCRSQQLLAYFGEKDTSRCGQCDVCLRRNELGLSKYEFDLILETIKTKLNEQAFLLTEVVDEADFNEDKTIKVIQWLLDNNKIKYNEQQKLEWIK